MFDFQWRECYDEWDGKGENLPEEDIYKGGWQDACAQIIAALSDEWHKVQNNSETWDTAAHVRRLNNED